MGVYLAGDAMDTDTRFEGLIAQGLAASREHQTQAALDFFAEASSLVPSSGIPHFLIGSEHAAVGQLEAAEAALANAVLLSPKFVLARYQLGLLQFSSARAAVALVTWEPLFALPATDSLGHFVRGFAALAQDQFEAALQHYREGLQCADLNPAIAADVQQVVDGVQRLLQTDSSSSADDSAHVLLASYGRRIH
jgi:tetratricopeptide (TPR) repeat protein